MDEFDLDTDEGLKAALRRIAGSGGEAGVGWDGELGGQLIEQVRKRARAVAARCARTCDVSVTDLGDAMVGVGWEVMATKTAKILESDYPWATVYRAMRQAAHWETRAAELVTSARHVATLHPVRAATAVRSDSAPVTATNPHSTETARVAGSGRFAAYDDFSRPADRWDVGLRALHLELVCAGAQARLAAAAIDAALGVVHATQRHSWIHWTAYRYEPLTTLMSRAQIKALMDLLVGSRYAGPHNSAWRALRDTAAGSDELPRLVDVQPKAMDLVQAVADGWAHGETPAGGTGVREPSLAVPARDQSHLGTAAVLRATLPRLDSVGWDSPLGDLLTQQLREQARAAAQQLASTFPRIDLRSAEASMVRAGQTMVTTRRDVLLRAADPWAELTRLMRGAVAARLQQGSSTAAPKRQLATRRAAWSAGRRPAGEPVAITA